MQFFPLLQKYCLFSATERRKKAEQALHVITLKCLAHATAPHTGQSVEEMDGTGSGCLVFPFFALVGAIVGNTVDEQVE
jgi:hypothetical protein